MSYSPYFVLISALCLSVSACSSNKSAPAQKEKGAKSPAKKPSAVAQSKPVRSRVGKRDPSPSPEVIPKPTDLRTPFRGVLKSGFRKKAPNTNLNYCRQSHRDILSVPSESVPFLEDKLTKGRLSEKPLALHLLGRLGPAARRAQCYIAAVAVRGFEVAYNRCLARLKGVKLGATAIEASPDEKKKCLQTVEGSRAPSSIGMACDALRRIGAKKSVRRLLKTGMAGYFAHDCVRYFLENDLESGESLVFVGSELYGKPNGALVKTLLIEQRERGIAALLKIMEAHVRQDRDMPCSLNEVARAYHSAGGLLSKLDPESTTRLNALAEGRLADGKEVPKATVLCAKRALSTLAMSPVETPRKRQAPPTESGTYPFCPTQ